MDLSMGDHATLDPVSQQLAGRKCRRFVRSAPVSDVEFCERTVGKGHHATRAGRFWRHEFGAQDVCELGYTSNSIYTLLEFKSYCRRTESISSRVNFR